LSPVRLNGLRGFLAIGFLSGVTSLAFLIPVGQMTYWAVLAWEKVDLPGMVSVFAGTVFISALSAAIILLLNITIGHRSRFIGGRIANFINRMTQVGYSVPGAIIAIGTLILFVSLDGLLYPMYQVLNPGTKKLVLSSSLVMLTFAYVVRYLAIGHSAVQSGFSKIGSRFREAAGVLGCSSGKTLVKIELPMLRWSLLAGFILVFIDVLKELPLTLLLRPFNYDSLATLVYVYSGDERIHEASVPSLAIVGISLMAVILLESITHREKGRTKV